jgi:hypothetical protein
MRSYFSLSMLHSYIIKIFPVFLISIHLCYAEDIWISNASQKKIKDFYIVTIPKAGTHLLAKLALLLTGRYPDGLHQLAPCLPNVSDEVFAETLAICKRENHFPFNHTGPFGQLFMRFSETHSEYVRILLIRDLRDVLVSYVYHIHKSLNDILGAESSFDERLSLVLDIENNTVGMEFQQNIINAIAWYNTPGVLIYRFEDLVGILGGGDAKVQKHMIRSLAQHLGLCLDRKMLKEVVQKLFGNDQGPRVSGTFREGKIGSWRSHFKPSHIDLFNAYWKTYQLSLGYPAD